VVEFHQGFIPIIVGIGSGLLTAMVAGFAAARRAGATRPTEALADAAVQRRWLGPVRLIGAVLCFGGGTALAIVTVTVLTGPHAAEEAFTRSLRADVVLSSTVGGGLPHDLISEVRSVPGVAAASEFLSSNGFVEQPFDDRQDDEGWPLQGVSADGVEATTAVDV